MRRRFLVLVSVVVALLALWLPSCGDDGDRLTVFSGRSKNLIDPLLQLFEDETGIKIQVRYGDSADLALLIDQEGDDTQADVFLSQSPGAIGFLDQRDRLAVLPDPVLDLVDEENHASDGNWVGLSGRVRTLVYDTEQIDESDLPDSVLELTDPEFAGQVALAPSNGSFQDFVTGLRLELGDDGAAQWLAGMAANDSPVYANNTAIVEAVGRGEVPMGLVNHYYNERAKAENPDASTENHFFPDGDIGTLLIVTAAGVIDTSEQSADAQRLVEHLLSEEAQTFYAEETFEYPLAAGVEPAPTLPPLSSIAVDRIDFDELGGGLERTAELIRESGLDRN